MYKRKQPANIKFYEDDSEDVSSRGTSKLMRCIRWCSFGLIKSDIQATVVVLILLAAATWGSVVFIEKNTTIPPTTYYELLPQESVGSEHGLPPKPQETYE